MGQAWHASPFVGWNTANISNSYSTGDLTVRPGPIPGGNGSLTFIKNYGGLVGYNASGKITNSYATGKITALGTSTYPPYYVGGLVGNLAGGSIEQSYASGNVTTVGGGNSFGGLVGIGPGALITNVYASGNLSASASASGNAPHHIGGLIGYKTGPLINGYSVGQVTAETKSNNVGGLIGYFSGTVSGRLFWDTTSSQQASSGGGTNVIGMPTAEMHNQANFTSATSANGNLNPNWDFSKIWGMDTGDYLYPVFNPSIGPVTTPGPQTLPALISYYPLTINNLNARNKIYDGTTAAIVSGNLTGVMPGDSVIISIFSGKFSDKNVGTAKIVDINTPTLSGEQVDKYVLAPLSNTTTANITPLAITVTADGVNKIYNGNTAATVTHLTTRGIINSDQVSVDYNDARFDTKNVGTGKTVTVNGIKLTGSDAANYTVNQPVTTSANITPLTIDVAANGRNKVYNGNTIAQVTLSGRGVIAGDDVRFTHSVANFNDKHVGTNKPITVTGISAGGKDAANYRVNTTTTTEANITPLAITFTADGVDKVYNGNRVAKVNNIKSSGIISSDHVSINYNNMRSRFNNKNVGTGKKITVDGITLTGSDAANYVVDQPVITNAQITPLAIKITARGRNKFYDGNRKARVILNPVGIMSGDSISFDYGSANFVTSGEGDNIRINVKGIIATGLDAVNYRINTEAITSAHIFAINTTTNPLLPLYIENRYTLQSVSAALQKPLTGCLYNSYGTPLSGCSFKNFEKLHVIINKEGVNLPNYN